MEMQGHYVTWAHDVNRWNVNIEFGSIIEIKLDILL